MNKVWRLAVLATAGGILMFPAAARAVEDASPKAACAGVTDAKSKSRLSFDGKTLMTNLLALEAQGESGFHPTFNPPASECSFEKFDAAGTSVEAVYAPFEKGEHTLHWRFRTTGAEPREVLVIYDGMASLIAEKEVFFVVEERKGSIHYYAMFREQPTYVVLKPIVTGVLDGSAQPLATVRWPPGEKEAVIEAYDSKRLK